MGGLDTIRVFTTRPDTLFGATYMVLAPEHPLVGVITTPKQKPAVEEYQTRAAQERSGADGSGQEEDRGARPAPSPSTRSTAQKIPIWIADYVLISYGTGAIMAVPAHDERDFEFAKEFRLPIRPVVMPPRGMVANDEHLRDPGAAPPGYCRQPGRGRQTEPTRARRSCRQTLPIENAKVITKATRVWERFGKDTIKVVGSSVPRKPGHVHRGFHRRGRRHQLRGVRRSANRRVQSENHRLAGSRRAWASARSTPSCATGCSAGNATGASRSRSCTSWTSRAGQRAWCAPLTADELPLTLPRLEDYKPSGGDKPEPPLEKATDWLYVTRDGKRYRRETNTMPQWAGSCWYYLRYLDPKNEQVFCDPAKEKYWMPVDLYVGGAEHAVLHLLYARFWHKVLFDRGHVHTPEPFGRLVNQGMILGETYHISPEAFRANTTPVG